MTSREENLIYLVIGFFCGLYLFYRGFKDLQKKRMIENTPTSKIRGLAMGIIEIYGTVIPSPGNLLKSPLTQKECVYYRYTIEEYRSSGKRGRWVIVKSAVESNYFYVKDETGMVLVWPKDADIDIPPDFSFESGLGKDPPPQIKQFLKTNNLSFEGFLGINKSMRYKEYYIAASDKLYIMGTAGKNPFTETATNTNNQAGIMIQKGTNNKFFYISDKPEKEVLKSMKWKVFAGVYGGAALSVGCLFILFLYFGML